MNHLSKRTAEFWCHLFVRWICCFFRENWFVVVRNFMHNTGVWRPAANERSGSSRRWARRDIESQWCEKLGRFTSIIATQIIFVFEVASVWTAGSSMLGEYKLIVFYHHVIVVSWLLYYNVDMFCIYFFSFTARIQKCYKIMLAIKITLPFSYILTSCLMCQQMYLKTTLADQCEESVTYYFQRSRCIFLYCGEVQLTI